MSCVLSIRGKNFDPEKFVKESGLQPYRIIHKGDPVYKSKPDGIKLEHSVLTFIASDADFDNLEKQIIDTITFLEKNKAGLLLIDSNKSIEYATLDFGVDLQIDRKSVLTQTVYF